MALISASSPSQSLSIPSQTSAVAEAAVAVHAVLRPSARQTLVPTLAQAPTPTVQLVPSAAGQPKTWTSAIER